MTDTLMGVSPLPKPASAGDAEDRELSPAELAAVEDLVRLARNAGIALTGPDGLLKAMPKTVVEVALEEEIADHVGYDKHAVEGRNRASSINGTRSNSLQLAAMSAILVGLALTWYVALTLLVSVVRPIIERFRAWIDRSCRRLPRQSPLQATTNACSAEVLDQHRVPIDMGAGLNCARAATPAAAGGRPADGTQHELLRRRSGQGCVDRGLDVQLGGGEQRNGAVVGGEQQF